MLGESKDRKGRRSKAPSQLIPEKDAVERKKRGGRGDVQLVRGEFRGSLRSLRFTRR